MSTIKITIERARPGYEADILDVFQAVSIETYIKLGLPIDNLHSYVKDKQIVSS